MLRHKTRLHRILTSVLYRPIRRDLNIPGLQNRAEGPASLTLAKSPLSGPETADAIDEQIDLSSSQLLAKSRHARLASRDYCSQGPGAGNARILFPPFGISKIRSVKKMASRRVAATIGSMTTGAISLEQFVNLRRRRMSCQLKCTNGGPGPGQQNNKHQQRW